MNPKPLDAGLAERLWKEETKKLLEISHDVKAALPEVRRIVSENAQYRRWLKVLVNPMSIATRIETWTEIRRVKPDLFKAKRRGRK